MQGLRWLVRGRGSSPQLLGPVGALGASGAGRAGGPCIFGPPRRFAAPSAALGACACARSAASSGLQAGSATVRPWALGPRRGLGLQRDRRGDGRKGRLRAVVQTVAFDAEGCIRAPNCDVLRLRISIRSLRVIPSLTPSQKTATRSTLCGSALRFYERGAILA